MESAEEVEVLARTEQPEQIRVVMIIMIKIMLMIIIINKRTEQPEQIIMNDKKEYDDDCDYDDDDGKGQNEEVLARTEQPAQIKSG